MAYPHGQEVATNVALDLRRELCIGGSLCSLSNVIIAQLVQKSLVLCTTRKLKKQQIFSSLRQTLQALAPLVH
jgi:hypothetical protein